MTYAELLDIIGREIKLDLSASAAPGSCVIRFDATLDVALDAALEGRVARLHISLGDATAGASAPLMMQLMQMHVFGIATDDAYFAWSAERERIVLFRNVMLADLQPLAAVELVGSFVNECVRWRNAWPALLAQSEADSARQQTHSPLPFFIPA